MVIELIRGMGALTIMVGLFFAFLSTGSMSPSHSIVAAILWSGGWLTVGITVAIGAIERQTQAALAELQHKP